MQITCYAIDNMLLTKSSKLMTKMKKQLKRSLSNDIKAIVAYESKKFSSKFHVKYKTNFCHKISLVYYGNCPNENCWDSYIGEIDQRIIDQNKRNKNSYLLRHVSKMETPSHMARGFQNYWK